MFKIISICKGGGYRYCRTDPPHPKANAKGLYPFHRVLMENHLGRLLADDEEVHHKDEDKTNDVIENLEVKTKSEHTGHHHPRIALVDCNCPCGKSFKLKRHQLRLRRKRARGPLCCSARCSIKYRSPAMVTA